MKEPIFLFDQEKGKKIEINGLRDFVEKAWLRENEIVINNEKVFENRISNLNKCVKILAKAGDKNSAKATLAFIGVIGIGYLAKKRFSKLEKRIKDLEGNNVGVNDDYEDLHQKIEELECELFEMNERLHALADKEVPKEE